MDNHIRGGYSWSTNQYKNENEDDYAYQSVGGTAEGMNTGKQNTMRILKKYPAELYPNSAAAVARAYQRDGYKDWFLPSKEEMMKLYRNKSAVGGFSDYVYYWSSTDFSAYNAWIQYFINGIQYYFNKNYILCVRAFIY